jgi:hypothetical protein
MYRSPTSLRWEEKNIDHMWVQTTVLKVIGLVLTAADNITLLRNPKNVGNILN